VQKDGAKVQFPGGQSIAVGSDFAQAGDGEYRAGFRAHHLELGGNRAGTVGFDTVVFATELTGSDTYIHLDVMGERWIGLVSGPQAFQTGAALQVSLDPKNIFYFGSDGALAYSAGQNAEREDA